MNVILDLCSEHYIFVGGLDEALNVILDLCSEHYIFVGGLDEALNVILDLCSEQEVPFVFALGRRALGRACAKLVPVSVVGVFSYEGSEVWLS